MMNHIKPFLLAAGILAIWANALCVQGQIVQTTVASFSGTNGVDPWASLVVGSDGNFYGTTFSGGQNTNVGIWGEIGYGTVFKVTLDGQLTCLASFNGTNGSNPTAGVVEGPDGAFYGTTWYGGSSNLGTVFRITTNGMLTTLVSFNGTNGASPRAALVLGKDGSLYGTARSGGASLDDPRSTQYLSVPGGGTIFKITTNGTLTTLYSFTPDTDGQNPIAPLVLANDGNFYGAADGGAQAAP